MEIHDIYKMSLEELSEISDQIMLGERPEVALHMYERFLTEGSEKTAIAFYDKLTQKLARKQDFDLFSGAPEDEVAHELEKLFSRIVRVFRAQGKDDRIILSENSCQIKTKNGKIFLFIPKELDCSMTKQN